MSAEQRWQIRIEHILEAIRKIERYTAGLSEETFASQDMAVDAVIRNFQVIGEAARHVPDDAAVWLAVREKSAISCLKCRSRTLS